MQPLPSTLLQICDRRFAVACPDLETAALLDVAFGALEMAAGQASAPADAACRIERSREPPGYLLHEGADAATWCADTEELLYQLDKFLTLAVQRLRPDLYFLHAAAVASNGSVAVLAAPSGIGKSTLTLALVEAGLTYLSDELAPIDLHQLVVHPFAHAVCLKPPLVGRVAPPPQTLRVGNRFHVPREALPGRLAAEPLRLGTFIFLRRSGRPSACEPLGAAAAAAHILSNALNPLAHGHDGLEPAVSLARRVPCFTLDVSRLPAAVAELRTVLGLQWMRS
jgi:hypothetical protein